jgi:glycosyltransferase involved in cell wall biosynthesis
VRASPRVVHVTTTDVSLALLLGPQLRAFADAGYEVIGCSAPGPYVAQLDAFGIRHVPLRHATRAMAPWRDVAALSELRHTFESLEPDIVHTHNPKPGIYGRIAARRAGVAVVINTVHGLYAQPHDALARRAVVYGLERVAARCSHAELVQNVEDLPVLRRLGVDPAKTYLLGNGIDLERFDPERVSATDRTKRRGEWGIEEGQLVVGVVGRLVWEKGLAEIADAARLLRRRAPHVRIVVVGPRDVDKRDAPSAEDLDLIEAIGNIRFVGEDAKVETSYAAFDIYALASYREGFPRSAMEAAAMGVPVIATDIRGCRQVVDGGRNGVLIPVRSARALADAIADLALSARERQAMGEAGREKARKNFDQRHCIDLTLAVYEDLLRRDRVTGAAA